MTVSLPPLSDDERRQLAQEIRRTKDFGVPSGSLTAWADRIAPPPPPPPLQIGDRVRLRSGVTGTLLATHGISAWVDCYDGPLTYALEALERL